MEARKSRFFYGYVVVVVAFFIFMAMLGGYNTFGVFFKPVQTEFGWTREMTSAAYSITLLLAGALGIGMGRLTDKFGPRLVMTGCGFFYGLGYLLMSQITGLWQLYLFHGVMMGIGMAGAFVPLASTVARWFVKRRGTMTGIFLAGEGVGIIIMSLLASRLVTTIGWSNSYLLIGSVILAILIIAAQFLRRDPSQKGLLPYGGSELKADGLNLVETGFSLHAAIRRRQFWLLFAMTCCFFFGVGATFVHVVPHATDLGISLVTAASILIVIAAVSIPGRIIMGIAADRIGNKSVFIICFILLAAALFLLLAAEEMWMFYVFAALFGFAFGGYAAPISPIVAELFGLISHGVIVGFVFLSDGIGSALGSVLVGRIFDTTGSYQLGFLISAVLCVIGLILALLLKPIVGEGGKND